MKGQQTEELAVAVENAFGKQSVISKDASVLEWKLWGYRPEVWRSDFKFGTLSGRKAEFMNIPARVPGSVQQTLKEAGLVSDWNIGLNYYSAEWITNRHWLYAARIPDGWLNKANGQIFLDCDGLDYKGTVVVNGKEAGSFDNAFIPYSFRIDPFLKETGNTIVIVFECPPENLGQVCWTSKIKDWKPRFNYGWDWVPRIVQIGIWDNVRFVTIPEKLPVIKEMDIVADVSQKEDKGNLKVKLQFTYPVQSQKVKITLADSHKPLISEEVSAKDLVAGKTWEKLKVKRWYPNGEGEQPLYRLQISFLNADGTMIQQMERRVGFRHIEWLPCEGAVAHAEPWVCSVNNKPLFLQGVNWTPIRPNFADLEEADYRLRLKLYKELGINVIRIWGGGFAEKDWLYDLCDELGILVWQDFPVSSSGLDNYPPTIPEVINVIANIADRYVTRLRHHPALLLWCAGNELYEMGDVAPVTDKHPLIGAVKKRVQLLDPTRKFVNGSPSGPNIYANYGNYGSGNNWDVHGPWTLPFKDKKQDMADVHDFWEKDDALFHSEVGAPGAVSAEMMRKYSGNHNPLPASFENPLWQTVNWWIEWDDYLSTHNGQAPATLEDYVNWSRQRQSEGLCIMLDNCKKKFPRCGGVILWMGHDCFPCPSNTSIIDFEGNPKQAALELSKIWKSNN
ncbi:MAG: hypothetical protein LBN71_04695 [Tannerella sp.]|nr:hypothetical protein [Tannerella sp.]